MNKTGHTCIIHCIHVTLTVFGAQAKITLITYRHTEIAKFKATKKYKNNWKSYCKTFLFLNAYKQLITKLTDLCVTINIKMQLL